MRDAQLFFNFLPQTLLFCIFCYSVHMNRFKKCSRNLSVAKHFKLVVTFGIVFIVVQSTCSGRAPETVNESSGTFFQIFLSHTIIVKRILKKEKQMGFMGLNVVNVSKTFLG